MMNYEEKFYFSLDCLIETLSEGGKICYVYAVNSTLGLVCICISNYVNDTDQYFFYSWSSIHKDLDCFRSTSNLNKVKNIISALM